MAERHTFPQPSDRDYAENFGQMIGHRNSTGYVDRGLGVSLSSATEASLNTGIAYIRSNQKTISDTGETRLSVGYAIQIPATTVTITDNTTNYLYITPNLNSNDNAKISVYTDQSNATSIELHIATIDASNDTVTEVNRDPDVEVASLSSSGDVSLTTNSPITLGSNDQFSLEYNGNTNEAEMTDSDGTKILSASQDGPFDFGAIDITTDGTELWNEAGSYIPQGRLENDSLTITAGDGLKNGGSVDLGSSTTIDIEPADFAGTYLSDDSADNLTVNIGDGLKNNGSGSIQTEPTDFAGSGLQDDGADNLELVNDSLTVTAGDGLKNGGTVSLGGSTTIDIEPADFAGTYLSDDGSDNLTVEVGNGLENDGSNNIRINPQDIAGNALTEDTATTIGVSSGAIGLNELNTPFTDLSDLVGSPVSTGANLSVGGTTTTTGPVTESANLPTQRLDQGEYTSLTRITVPSGNTLRLKRVSVVNDSFNAPAGLEVLVRNASTGTTETTYNTTFTEGEPVEDISVGGDNVIIAVDNGNWNAGTGSTQYANATVEYDLV
jgi:hypothetical protein